MCISDMSLSIVLFVCGTGAGGVHRGSQISSAIIVIIIIIMFIVIIIVVIIIIMTFIIMIITIIVIIIIIHRSQHSRIGPATSRQDKSGDASEGKSIWASPDAMIYSIMLLYYDIVYHTITIL